MTNTPQAEPRSYALDWLRAFAIFLMVGYHLTYDIASAGIFPYAVFLHPATTFIGRICLCLFLLCAGYSLALVHGGKILWSRFWRRWMGIAGAAVAVSIATLLAFPANWIYFGILHCIAVSSLLCLPFLRLPKVALVTGVVMMIAHLGWGLHLPWIHLNQASLDYISVFPWMGMMLIGIGLFPYRLHERVKLPQSRSAEWLSRHSLLVYLLHQPLLMGTIKLLQLLL
jgi:uncharacterized membrane protein